MRTGPGRCLALWLLWAGAVFASGCSDDGGGPTVPGDEVVQVSIEGRVGTPTEWFPNVRVELGYWYPLSQSPGWRTWAETLSGPGGAYSIRAMIVRRGNPGWPEGNVWSPGCHDLILAATIEDLPHRQFLGPDVCDGSGSAVRDIATRHVEVAAAGTVRYTNGEPVGHARVTLADSVGTTGEDGRYAITARVLDGRCDPTSDFFARDQMLRLVVAVFSGGAQQGAESEPLSCGAHQIDLTIPEPASASGEIYRLGGPQAIEPGWENAAYRASRRTGRSGSEGPKGLPQRPEPREEGLPEARKPDRGTSRAKGQSPDRPGSCPCRTPPQITARPGPPCPPSRRRRSES